MKKVEVTIGLGEKVVSMDDITRVDYKFVLNESVTLDIDTKSQGSFHFESDWSDLNEVNKIVTTQRIIEAHTSGPLGAVES